MTALDFAPLLAPNLPPAAVKYGGFPKYNFVGGHNDAEHVPLDEIVAATTAVLQREGRTLASYGLASGPQGYRPLREFLASDALDPHLARVSAGVHRLEKQLLVVLDVDRILDNGNEAIAA